MKKTNQFNAPAAYVSPEATVFEVKPQRMVCTSDGWGDGTPGDDEDLDEKYGSGSF